MRVRRLTAGLAATLLLPLGACTDGDNKADPTEPTSSATPSATETEPDGPTLPPEARGDDEAAAKAFVKFYFELVSDAVNTGEVTHLVRFSASNCQSCNALTKNLTDVYGKGGRFETKGWTAGKLAVDRVRDSDQLAFIARIEMSRRTLFDENDKVVKVEPRRSQAVHLLLERDQGEWVMLRMGLL